MDIDLSIIPFNVLNTNLTRLAKEEYMKDYDMKSSESMKIRESDERVEEISVEVKYSDGLIALSVSQGSIPNEAEATWKDNFMTMAYSLLYSQVQDLLESYKEQLAEQVRPFIMELIGGAFA